jgi:MFS family permease
VTTGRKIVFLSALVLLAICDLLCGFSQNATMLYIFRALAGVANGGITSLSMMIVSDIVTLKERGKYQGILGACVGLGNMVGRSSIRTALYLARALLACQSTCSALLFDLLLHSASVKRVFEAGLQDCH